jgi:hypothetical protein
MSPLWRHDIAVRDNKRDLSRCARFPRSHEINGAKDIRVNVNRSNGDEMNGTEYEDKAATEWKIVTDVDRFCGAKRCKSFWAEAVGRHVAYYCSCHLYVKRAFWCSIEIEYRYGAAIFRSDVGCAHHLHPDACELLQQMGRLRLKCDGPRAETGFRLSAKRTSSFKSARTSVQSNYWQPRCAHQR